MTGQELAETMDAINDAVVALARDLRVPVGQVAASVYFQMARGTTWREGVDLTRARLERYRA
jgi:hypothetical protein